VSKSKQVPVYEISRDFLTGKLQRKRDRSEFYEPDTSTPFTGQVEGSETTDK
jgi:hypothetical protein